MRYIYEATVLKIVDGDTLDVSVDLGFQLSSVQRVRLAGLDAPEKREPGGADSTQFLLDSCPVGAKIVVETFKWKDNFGRYLATVYVDDVNINQTMLEKGLAKIYER